MPTFKIPTAISFSGCGFIGVYHIGLVRCLQIYGKQVIPHITKYGGASAGSLAAAVFAICPHKVLECKKLVYDLGEQVRKTRFGALNTGFNLSEHVEKLVDSVLPADAHELANDRVFISVTRKSCGKNFIISRYESRSDLIQCLVSSSHIPFYSGSKYPIFRGEKYYDGGFTDNLIDFKKEETIYVTPFAGGQTYICPNDPITSFNYTVKNQNFCLNINNLARGFDALRPPSSKALETYYEQGFVDGLRYLAKLSKGNSSVFELPFGNVNPRTRNILLNSVANSRFRPTRSRASTKVSNSSQVSVRYKRKRSLKGKAENKDQVQKTEALI